MPIGSTINGVYLENNNSRVPMLIASPAFVTVEVRGGYQLAEHWSLRFGAANLADSAYRVHGSGVDGPGAGLFLGVRWAF